MSVKEYLCKLGGVWILILIVYARISYGEDTNQQRYQGQPYSSKDLKGIPWIFSVFDTNRNGSICTDEVKVVLNRMMGQGKEEEVETMLKNLMDIYDTNKDGMVTQEEFYKKVAYYLNHESYLISATAQAYFDIDYDGFVTKDEYKHRMLLISKEVVSDDEAGKAIRAAAGNEDGPAPCLQFGIWLYTTDRKPVKEEL